MHNKWSKKYLKIQDIYWDAIILDIRIEVYKEWRPSVDNNVEEFSSIASGNAKFYGHFGKEFGNFLWR